MTDFFNCSIKSPQCTDMYSKEKFSIAIFLPRVLMYQKRQISLPVGYKNRTLGMIVTSFQLLVKYNKAIPFFRLLSNVFSDFGPGRSVGRGKKSKIKFVKESGARRPCTSA